MTRVPVPDGFAEPQVIVSPTHEAASLIVGGHNRNAHVEVEDAGLARDLAVREDDDGRYVGAHETVAERVAAYFRDEFDGYDYDPDGGGDADAGDDDDEVPTADLIEQGVCPWCEDYEGDGVPQHASAAHPEEWAAHTED